MNDTIVEHGVRRVLTDVEQTAYETQTAIDIQDNIDRANAVPQTITRYQARIALIDAGKMGAVKAALNDPNADEKMVEAWMHKEVFDRDSTYINDMAAALGITQNAVDNLFKAAALVE